MDLKNIPFAIDTLRRRLLERLRKKTRTYVGENFVISCINFQYLKIRKVKGAVGLMTNKFSEKDRLVKIPYQVYLARTISDGVHIVFYPSKKGIGVLYRTERNFSQ